MKAWINKIDETICGLRRFGLNPNRLRPHAKYHKIQGMHDLGQSLFALFKKTINFEAELNLSLQTNLMLNLKTIHKA